MNNLTQDLLHELFDYDPETGKLTNRAGRNVTAGAEAGSIKKGKWADYRRVILNGSQYYSHRLIWVYVHGETPRGQIDHVNGDGLDNRMENLRDVTNTENSKNQKIRSTNTSGVTGVSWDQTKSSWAVSVSSKYVGRFKDKDDAIRARKQSEIDHGYHPNHGRSE